MSLGILLFFFFFFSFSITFPRYLKREKKKSYWLGIPIGILLGFISGLLIGPAVDGENNGSAIFLIVFFSSLLFMFIDKKDNNQTSTIHKQIEIEPVKDKSAQSKLEPQPFSQSKETIQFFYTDYEGNFTHRTVDVKQIDSEYLEAYCHNRKANRTFKVERIDDEIIDVSTGEILTKQAWLAKHDIYVVEKYDPIDFDYEDELFEEICFTGFKKTDREHLETLAIINNYIVRKTVTKNLDYLVCGLNAGPTKMAQAEKNGAIILTEQEFLEMVGEDD